MNTGRKKLLLFALFILILYSCGSHNNKSNVNEISNILSSSPDALKTVLDQFQKSNIVFIGSSTHQLLNDKTFLSSNLQHFYNAGVRYILSEGGIDEGPVYSDEILRKKPILLFYPWEYVGVRYGTSNLLNEIYLFNIDKKEQDKIKYIGLESGRINFIDGAFTPIDIYNYRDEYMSKTAFEFIDNSKAGTKFLIIGGSAHGNSEIVPNAFGSSVSWKPLGAYLKEKYNDNYFSFCYITLDEKIKTDNSYQIMLNSKKWHEISNIPVFITPLEILVLGKLLNIFYDPKFDGYIVDKIGKKGIMYGYALFDPEVLIEVIKQTRQLDVNISTSVNGNSLDYNDYNTWFSIKNLLINIYYLKLFFGDYFPYDLWNPKNSLNEALSILESTLLLNNTNPKDIMAFHLPSIDIIQDYHDYIYYFNTLENNFWDISMQNKIKKQIVIAEPFIKKSKELFPFELWTYYWYSKMYIKNNNYKKAHKYNQLILNHPLVYSMQNFPEILDFSIKTAEILGLHDIVNKYLSVKDSLWNEYSIEVEYFSLFLN